MGAQRPLFHCHGDWSEKVMGRELIPELHTHSNTHTHTHRYSEYTHTHAHTFSIWNPESPGSDSQKVGHLRVETHAREQNVFPTSLPPKHPATRSPKFFFEAVFKLMWSFLLQTWKADRLCQRVSHGCFCDDDPGIEPSNLLRNTETNPPTPLPPSLGATVPDLTPQT